MGNVSRSLDIGWVGSAVPSTKQGSKRQGQWVASEDQKSDPNVVKGELSRKKKKEVGSKTPVPAFFHRFRRKKNCDLEKF